MNGCASDFELVAPQSLSHALTLLAAGFRPIAGGTDLMVLYEAGRLPFRQLVSVAKLDQLRRIEVTDDHVSVGAAVTYSEIRAHSLLQREFALLCQAASWTGGIANQNRGTLGGNIVNASPAADSPPVLLVYEAELELISLSGARRVSYESFHLGYKSMQMEPGELLVRIILPRPSPAALSSTISYARKVGARKAQAISKVGMAALARMDGERVAEVRIAVASVAPVPLRCRQAERAMMTSRADALEALEAEIAPIDDIRSTGEYRRKVALNLLGEFLDLLEPLAIWDNLPPREAETALLKCCGSSRWAAQLAAARPFRRKARLFEAADVVWRNLAEWDWLEAFRAHPRIGESVPQAGAWSAQEQAGMSAAAGGIRALMAAANREYEDRFGFIYIVCASGKSAAEMLAIIQSRLRNSRAEELAEAAEQQRRITGLRLRKWLGP
jgi:OHCU decarboxylase